MTANASTAPGTAVYASLLPELEAAIARGSAAQRTQTMRRMTQLFVSGAEGFSEAQIELFDEVFGRLIEEIEARAQAELAGALAPVGNAPVGLVRRLAHSDDIAVAGPILQISRRLPEDDLIAIARTKGQTHLMAIAQRPALDPTVADLLVRRGDRDVVHRLVDNPAARLSETGYAALVKRASSDGELAERVAQRADIPPTLFRRLVTQASTVVQQRLFATAAPERRDMIRTVMARLTDEVGAAPPRDYAGAQEEVTEMLRTQRLTEAALAESARAGRFELVVAALSALCEVPIEVVDRLFNGDKPDPILILCKALRLSRSTVAAVLSLRLPHHGAAMDAALDHFERLTALTARRVVQFWRAPLAPRPAHG
jgi:uncharacterized protein (DUF2336 family)